MIKNIFRSLFVDDLLEASAATQPYRAQTLKQRLKQRLKDLARITLFSYLLLVFNPVMPLIANKMAHTFWKDYHLLTIHQVNGTFHVHLELSKAAAQSEKDRSSGSNKSFSEEYAHVISVTSFDFISHYCISVTYIPYKLQFPVSYPDLYYQPPKVRLQHFELV